MRLMIRRRVLFETDFPHADSTRPNSQGGCVPPSKLES